MVSSNNSSVSNKVIAIQNALIKLANLSFKTQEISKTLKLNIPADEPGKISLTNLLALTKLSFPNNNSTSSTSHAFSPYDEEKIKDILGNINISIANKMPVELNKEEIAFLTNYVLIQEDEFNNLDTMKQKVEYYLEFIKKLKINNFKTNSEYKFDSAEASKDILSYADLGYFSSLINEESTIADKPLLSKLHSVLAKYLGSMIGKGDGPIIDKTLNLYSM
jgi:ABC transporter permease protein